MSLYSYSSLFGLDRELMGSFDFPVMRGIRWDLVEQDESYLIEAELAGVNPDNIFVRTNNGILTIEAKKEESKNENNKKYHYQERTSGFIKRSVRLPSNSDVDGIVAQYTNGLLKVTIPKTFHTSSKQITIQRD